MEELLSYAMWIVVALMAIYLLRNFLENLVKPNYTEELRRRSSESDDVSLEKPKENEETVVSHKKKKKSNAFLFFIILYAIFKFFQLDFSNKMDRTQERKERKALHQKRLKEIRKRALERRKEIQRRMQAQKKKKKVYDISPGNDKDLPRLIPKCSAGTCLVRQIVWENSSNCFQGKRIYDQVKCRRWACDNGNRKNEKDVCIQGHAGQNDRYQYLDYYPELN